MVDEVHFPFQERRTNLGAEIRYSREITGWVVGEGGTLCPHVLIQEVSTRGTGFSVMVRHRLDLN